MLLEVEAEQEELDQSLGEAYRHLVKKVEVPGFRKGKAPREMLERYIGHAALLEEAIEDLVPRLLSKAIEEQGLDVIARPQIEITQVEPVTFKATVSLPPTVELGNYREISIEKEAVEVTEEEIDKVIDKVRTQNAVWEPVERPVAFNDLVTMDVSGSSGEDQLIEQKDLQMQVVKDMPAPVPGFSEQLEGMEKDQEKEFAISVPDDFGMEEIAGKECNFKVKINEVKEQRLSEVDDEFAKSLGGEFDSIESMRININANLTNAYESGAIRRYEQKVLDAVVEISKLEFPPVLVEQEIDRVIAEQEQELAMRRVTLEDYLKSQQKSVEELRESLKPLAIKQIQISMVVDKVIEQQGLQAGDEEIDAEIERMAESVGERADDLRNTFQSPVARRSIARNIVAGKAVKLLMDIASGEAEAAAPELPSDVNEAESQVAGGEPQVAVASAESDSSPAVSDSSPDEEASVPAEEESK